MFSVKFLAIFSLFGTITPAGEIMSLIEIDEIERNTRALLLGKLGDILRVALLRRRPIC